MALPSCAVVVDPAPDYDRLVDEVRSVSGAACVHHPSRPGDADEDLARLLDGGLTAGEAVEAGLLGNPGLQARFHAVGIGRADRVQAGLLANPSLSAALRLPAGGGSRVLEAGVFESLADLWRRAAREEVAEAEVQRLVLEVAHDAALLAADIRLAHLEAVTAALGLEVAEANHALAAQLVELTGERMAARAATAVEARLAEGERLGAELAVRDARLHLAESRRRLAALLGLRGEPAGLALSDAPDLPSEALPTPERLRELALERRLDVRAARAALERAAAELRLQQGLGVRILDVGLVAEREGGWSMGPGVVVEIPVFDGNEARVARAREVLAVHERTLAAVRLAAVHETESSRARWRAGQEALALCTDALLPQAEATLDLARERYRAGSADLLHVIGAQRDLLRARSELVRRRREAATALSDLERATGATREQLVSSASDERRSP